MPSFNVQLSICEGSWPTESHGKKPKKRSIFGGIFDFRIRFYYPFIKFPGLDRCLNSLNRIYGINTWGETRHFSTGIHKVRETELGFLGLPNQHQEYSDITRVPGPPKGSVLEAEMGPRENPGW